MCDDRGRGRFDGEEEEEIVALLEEGMLMKGRHWENVVPMFVQVSVVRSCRFVCVGAMVGRKVMLRMVEIGTEGN